MSDPFYFPVRSDRIAYRDKLNYLLLKHQANCMLKCRLVKGTESISLNPISSKVFSLNIWTKLSTSVRKKDFLTSHLYV